ncbi:MAG: HDOD domain-containing protein [Planctomycetota bacterium]|jgi:HD-like signal output (HDOD) protein
MPIDSAKARKKIEAITDLPTLPTVASQIVAIANSPKTSATDVGALINNDQALTTKVLKLVNSSFYGFPQQIKTINHAIVILGFNKVKNIVLTASVFDLTKGKDGDRIDIRKFWEHSLGCAIAAQIVAQHLGRGLSPDDAFVGGLLHDFGKIIFDQFLPDEYDPVIKHCKENKTLIRTSEKEILGFDHSQVGTWLAEMWKLPVGLVTAIRYHHLPQSAREEREMAAAVHIGDILTRSLGVGNGGDGSIPALSEPALKLYNLDIDFLRKALSTLAEELKKAGDFFDLIEN